ncbi:hypothetical protein BDW59DRAFT_175998 [Aspergillus cavernicola]|uniref:2-oxoadipate dioxygenase/decarboxylase n=1 Tax=Aspergillus cavernicola TaxID=176166 RepID=A0ABR4HM45_9EURO
MFSSGEVGNPSSDDPAPARTDDPSPARLLPWRATATENPRIRVSDTYDTIQSQELQTLRRIFALIGMYPVGYFDLAVAALPMHATSFRPVDKRSLQKTPFRVLTTILRLELLRSDAAQNLALSLLKRRQISIDELLRLLDVAGKQRNQLTQSQAEKFIAKGLRSFSWQCPAVANHSQYSLLNLEHPILADISCFRSAHINHLTPRTLDMNEAQSTVLEAGMAVKSRIEGPPPRKCPILWRQTSFLALEEKIRSPSRNDHIEERRTAVTPTGQRGTSDAANPRTVDEIMSETFQQYPDDWSELWRQGLVYCEYQCTGKAMTTPPLGESQISSLILEHLIADGVVEAIPITYEDFLLFSAAGIFQLNLQVNSKSSRAAVGGGSDKGKSSADLECFERALRCRIFDSDKLYVQVQKQSLESCAKEPALRAQVLW